MAELIKKQPNLELMAPVPINTVCFSYKNGEISAEALDDFNHNLSIRLIFSGAGAASETKIKDRKVMQVCITNHRTTRQDVENFVASAAKMGSMMAEELKIKSF
jgi:aromatic-L-amino-acid/L-tryptophan decarboxylase